MRYPGEEIRYLKQEVKNWEELTDKWKHIAESLVEELEGHRRGREQILEALETIQYLKEG